MDTRIHQDDQLAKALAAKQGAEMTRFAERALALGPAQCSQLFDELLGFIQASDGDEKLCHTQQFLEKRTKELLKEADEREKNKEKEYTVLLLYPDYMADEYGKETWMCSARGKTPEEAIRLAQEELAADQGDDDVDLDDFHCLCCIEGSHQDLAPR